MPRPRTSVPPASPPLVLDAAGRQKLVEDATGKSARQVRRMLADLDPELATPADRMRPLGDGRYELKALIDADCQQGLEQFRGLLSHMNPRMTLGQLVGRVVQEALDRRRAITVIGTRRRAHRAFLKDEPCSHPVIPPVVSPTGNPDDPSRKHPGSGAILWLATSLEAVGLAAQARKAYRLRHARWGCANRGAEGDGIGAMIRSGEMSDTIIRLAAADFGEAMDLLRSFCRAGCGLQC